MDILIEEFFKELSRNRHRLLLLDYDGTLAPFRKDRDLALPYPGVEDRLNRLLSLEKTQVTIISGRAVYDLKPLLNLKKYPEIWGSHGWEKLSPDGKYSLMEIEERHGKGLEIAANFISENNLNSCLEIKPVSLAIHYRGLSPEIILEIEHKIVNNWNGLEAEYNLTHSRFDGGLELRIPGNNKGSVVKNVTTRFPDSTLAAYLGDDLTDEDAFAALPESALSVLVRSEYRKTGAKVWLKPPRQLLEFFDRWIEIDTPA